jgi:transposase
VLRPVEVPPIPEATAALAWQVHPRGTDEMRVRDELGPLFTDANFADGPLAGMFSELGQPGLSPGLLLMVVILQFRHNLCDRQAVEALADRISWKYALSRELSDPGFDHTVLSEFRTRLAEEGRADAVLEVILTRLKDAGLVKAGGRQRTDSSHVIGCVRRLNRIETAARTGPRSTACAPGWRNAISQAVRSLAKAHVQNVLTGMALNVTRLGTHFNTDEAEQETDAETRPSMLASS